LLAVLIMPASAYRLKLSANQNIGCKMLNKVMSDFMGDEDFLDCNDQQSDHIHMQSVNQCMRVRLHGVDGEPWSQLAQLATVATLSEYSAGVRNART
jgi:hypothetical protein